jgi:hypothetical protein
MKNLRSFGCAEVRFAQDDRLGGDIGVGLWARLNACWARTVSNTTSENRPSGAEARTGYAARVA